MNVCVHNEPDNDPGDLVHASIVDVFVNDLKLQGIG